MQLFKIWADLCIYLFVFLRYDELLVHFIHSVVSQIVDFVSQTTIQKQNNIFSVILFKVNSIELWSQYHELNWIMNRVYGWNPIKHKKQVNIQQNLTIWFPDKAWISPNE